MAVLQQRVADSGGFDLDPDQTLEKKKKSGTGSDPQDRKKKSGSDSTVKNTPDPDLTLARKTTRILDIKIQYN